MAWLTPAHGNQVLTIQPILAGSSADPNLPQDLLFANAIYAQAGIIINPLLVLTNSALSDNLATTFTGYTSFLNTWTPPDSTTLPVWFVGTINSSSAYLGTSFCYLSACGVWVANSASLPATLQPDVLAHEIAHLLTGFNAITSPISGDPAHSSDPFNLLATGGARHIPTSIADISPDGLRYDQITLAQSVAMEANSFLVDELPEPATPTLFVSGLLMLVAVRRAKTR
jgi:hypothetical protein